VLIDGLQFARSESELSGKVDGSKLPRLSDMQCSTAEIRFNVRGGTLNSGKLGLTMLLSGQLQLTCQRCLQPLEHELEVKNELELSESLETVEATDDDVDRVLASPAMDVAALVEDEAILALPMIPRHEQCEAASSVGIEAKKSSLFDALAILKNRRT